MYNTEEELKAARLAFLEDTIAYYSADVSRRAASVYEGCCYRTSDGRKCAIGRHIPDDKYVEDIENKAANYTDVLALLPLEVAALSTSSYTFNRTHYDFLHDVQRLHDHGEYWNITGLSEYGVSQVNVIKQRYKLGDSNG